MTIKHNVHGFLGYSLLIILVKHQTLICTSIRNNDGCRRDYHFFSIDSASNVDFVLSHSSLEQGICTIIPGLKWSRNEIHPTQSKSPLIGKPSSSRLWKFTHHLGMKESTKKAFLASSSMLIHGITSTSLLFGAIVHKD